MVVYRTFARCYCARPRCLNKHKSFISSPLNSAYSLRARRLIHRANGLYKEPDKTYSCIYYTCACIYTYLCAYACMPVAWCHNPLNQAAHCGGRHIQICFREYKLYFDSNFIDLVHQLTILAPSHYLNRTNPGCWGWNRPESNHGKA